MRIQYTLPGLIPAETPSVESGEASLFRGRLTVPVTPRGMNWRNLLRLDELPANAFSIGPPPRPESASDQDAATERVYWRQMLDQQMDWFESDPDPGDPARLVRHRAVKRMLTMLLRFQDLEDSMAARHLSEAEE
jgi:hypothetical protein